VFMGGTVEDMRFIQQRAVDAGVSFIIHAGDLTHGPSEFPEYVRLYSDCPMPVYHALGNHDTDHTPLAETLRLYNMPDGHYFFDCEGYRFIVCDPNYCLIDGKYIHYDMGNYYAHEAQRDWMPPEQLAWLRETIDGSPFPCVLISHASFEREADGVQNQMAVRRIINEANRRKPGSVLMCMNGHYHRDFVRILDNVCYMDVNSGTGEYVDVRHECYGKELHDAIPGLKCLVCYDPLPVYCVVTVEGTTITVDGMEGGLLQGITREMTGNKRFDPAGRETTGGIQSFKIKLW